MPDVYLIFSKWWKLIVSFVLIACAITAVLLILQPRKFLSETTALRASSYTNDKASIFNKNIEGLYSTLGSSDDLDMIVGTAQLDTVYLFLTDQYNLVKYYKIHGNPVTARQKAANRLKKNSQVFKSGYGELKVMVWDKDKQQAPQFANSIMDKLQAIHRQLLNESNLSTLQSLKSGYIRIKSSLDTISSNTTAILPSKQELMQRQLQQYEELISEYELIVDTKQPALLVVEKARPALKPDKPRFMSILVGTAFISFIFALLLAVLLERKQTKPV